MGCGKSQPGPSPATPTAQTERERTIVHLNILCVGESPNDRATLAAALSQACAESKGGKAADPAQLRKAQQANQTAIVECGTARRGYAQILPATGLTPQSFLFSAGMSDGAVVLLNDDGRPPAEVCNQLFTASAAGVPRLIIFVNQDGHAAGMRLPQGDQPEGLRTVLARCGYDPAGILILQGHLRGSDGGQSARELLAAMEESLKPRFTNDRGPFMMAVEDVFHIEGRGVVATGSVQQGTVRAGEGLELVGRGQRKAVSCRKIEYFRGELSVARPGDNVGLWLGGVQATDLTPGEMLSAPGSLELQQEWTGTVTVLTREEGGVAGGLPVGWRGRVIIGRAEGGCRGPSGAWGQGLGPRRARRRPRNGFRISCVGGGLRHALDGRRAGHRRRSR
jgi:elongation factor Tu